MIGNQTPTIYNTYDEMARIVRANKLSDNEWTYRGYQNILGTYSIEVLDENNEHLGYL